MGNDVRIGVNPIGWSNDDKRDLGGDTPLETCLCEARRAGYAGIELGHKFPRDAGILTPILNAHDLALVSGWYSSALLERSVDDEIRALEPHLSLLKVMGCAVVVWAETTGAVHGNPAAPMRDRPMMSNAQFDLFSGRLSRIADHTRAQGIQLVYHHHMGTVIETEAEIDRLMASTGPAVGLLLDTGHLTVAGGDVTRVATRHRDRIHHFHAKDVRLDMLDRVRQQDWSFLTAVVAGLFTVPGDGGVDFAAPLGVLADAGYRGWLVVEAEQDPAVANPFQYAQSGYRALEGYARDAGLI